MHLQRLQLLLDLGVAFGQLRADLPPSSRLTWGAVAA
jgi:hypothetical protein